MHLVGWFIWMTKLIVAYRNFAKAPKNVLSSDVKCVVTVAWTWSFIELSTLNYFGDAVVEGVNERDKFYQILKNVRSIHQELILREGAQTSWQLVFPHVQRLPENKKIKTVVGFRSFLWNLSSHPLSSALNPTQGMNVSPRFKHNLRSQKGTHNVEATTIRLWPSASG
jgi:hypothetical protein